MNAYQVLIPQWYFVIICIKHAVESTVLENMLYIIINVKYCKQKGSYYYIFIRNPFKQICMQNFR